MIKIIDFLLLTISCVSTSFCSKNNSGSYSKNNGEPDIFYVGSIPNNFVCYEKEYMLHKSNANINSLEFKQIGWLINYKDLEKWKEIDRDDSLVYAVSMKNEVERNYHGNDNLVNRYELYCKKTDETILAVTDMIYIEKE